MALWWDRGQVIDDSQEGARVPEGATRVDTYRNPAQYGSQEFGWDPANRYFSGNIQSNAPGYLADSWPAASAAAGHCGPGKRRMLGQWEAGAMPTRDIGSLTAGWQGDPGERAEDWWTRLILQS